MLQKIDQMLELGLEIHVTDQGPFSMPRHILGIWYQPHICETFLHVMCDAALSYQRPLLLKTFSVTHFRLG